MTVTDQKPRTRRGTELVLLIFAIVFMAFGSLRQALLVYSGIPLAVTGGVLALWLRGMPFSITAAIGFIALSGVAVLDGVVMVSCFNRLREEGLTLLQAVREGMALPLEEAMALEKQLVAEVSASADTREGVSAFLEKREPRWSDR